MRHVACNDVACRYVRRGHVRATGTPRQLAGGRCAPNVLQTAADTRTTSHDAF